MDASAAPRPAHAAARSARLLRAASDERLVAMVRAGHEAAFETIYDRHHRGILAFCRHMLGQREDAEDAVQHTFLAAYNDLRRSARDIQLRAWLYAIARNRCLSMLRARREQPAGEMVEPATEGLTSEVQRREDLRELLRDMDGLPDDQRAALVLAELGAMSHDEIGEVIGVPREKVKALVFQARESLIASRSARNADCTEIRAELATLRGGALRRTHLRRHLRECAGCREFRDQVADQRKSLALILPVVPTLGLKQAVLGATGGGGAGGGAGGLLAVAGVKGGLLKLCVITGLLGAGTTGAVVGLSALGENGARGATGGAQGAAGQAGAAGFRAGDPEHALAAPFGAGAPGDGRSATSSSSTGQAAGQSRDRAARRGRHPHDGHGAGRAGSGAAGVGARERRRRLARGRRHRHGRHDAGRHSPAGSGPGTTTTPSTPAGPTPGAGTGHPGKGHGHRPKLRPRHRRVARPTPRRVKVEHPKVRSRPKLYVAPPAPAPAPPPPPPTGTNHDGKGGGDGGHHGRHVGTASTAMVVAEA